MIHNSMQIGIHPCEMPLLNAIETVKMVNTERLFRTVTYSYVLRLRQVHNQHRAFWNSDMSLCTATMSGK